MGRSILVTGAEGYLGRQTIQLLSRHGDRISCIVAHDIKTPSMPADSPLVHPVVGDIRSPEIGNFLDEYNVDTVIHLASIVSPGKKSRRDFEYSVDVLGTENLLQACIRHGVGQLIVTSSGAAYGYHADNPAWLRETDPLRGNDEFAYACHKRLVEEMLARYRLAHPALRQLVLRPGTILGEHTQNQITDLFRKRYLLGVRGSEVPFVFIWDRDVAEIIVRGVLEDRTGIYNVAGDGCLTMRQIAQMLDKPLWNVPAGVLKPALFLLKLLGLSQYGPEQLNFLRYRPVLSNEKLKSEFGYIPRMSSAEVFAYYMQHNLMPAQQRRIAYH